MMVNASHPLINSQIFPVDLRNIIIKKCDWLSLTMFQQTCREANTIISQHDVWKRYFEDRGITIIFPNIKSQVIINITKSCLYICNQHATSTNLINGQNVFSAVQTLENTISKYILQKSLNKLIERIDTEAFNADFQAKLLNYLDFDVSFDNAKDLITRGLLTESNVNAIIIKIDQFTLGQVDIPKKTQELAKGKIQRNHLP